MIKLDKVSKIYYNNGVIGTGFSKVSTEFNIGEFVAILGESGSGKSTLLNVISGLDSYEEGEMYINGEETSHYAEEDFEEYRRKYVANIFQAFNLVNSYSVRQNVELVLLINGNNIKKSKKRVDEILKKVGLFELRNKKVSKLSGGQKQRVAIARALAKETPIIVADEPTGNLDQASAKAIFELLNEIAKDKLVIVVTHNFEQVKDYATRVLRMHDGKLIEDKVVTKIKNVRAHESVINKMSFGAKVLLSIRNAFNVLPKFLINLVVFIIVAIVLLGNYASFKSDEYYDFIDSVYGIFNDNSPERIIVNKQDKSVINDDDLKKIENIKGVNSYKEKDYIYDAYIGFDFNQEYYLNGTVKSLSDFDGELAKGRMPNNDNEIVVVGSKDNYDFSSFYLDEWFDVFGTLSFSQFNYTDNVKVVGIAYDSKMEDSAFYLSDKLLDFIDIAYILNVYDYKLTIGNELIDSGKYMVGFSNVVPQGEVYINTYYYSDIIKENLNKMMHIEATSMYDTISKDLKFTKTYNSETNSIIEGDMAWHDILISMADVEDFRSKVFQVSVYADSLDMVDTVIEELEGMGYNAYAVKDTGYISSEMLQIFRFANYCMIVIVIAILFGVSYYIIYLVLKSRVTYFAVVRMLGGNVKLNKELVNYELFIDATIGFIITLGLMVLVKNNIIKIEALSNAISFLKVIHFVIVYLILILISQMISHKYARKIFKDSMITTYNMEV